MNNSYIISKMNEFMFQLNGKMGNWLNKKLPTITDNWWQELVVNNLSTLQREHVLNNGITSIDGLDLAELLRVFDRNWFVITSRFFVIYSNATANFSFRFFRKYSNISTRS